MEIPLKRFDKDVAFVFLARQNCMWGVSFRTVEASKFSWGIRIAESNIRIDPPVGCSDGQVLGDAPDAFLGDAPGQVLEGVPEESV